MSLYYYSQCLVITYFNFLHPYKLLDIRHYFDNQLFRYKVEKATGALSRSFLLKEASLL